MLFTARSISLAESWIHLFAAANLPDGGGKFLNFLATFCIVAKLAATRIFQLSENNKDLSVDASANNPDNSSLAGINSGDMEATFKIQIKSAGFSVGVAVSVGAVVIVGVTVN